MKTQYYTASSLDGFIADSNHSLEWLFTLGDVEESSYPAFIHEVGALAMGSSTYEWMLRHAVGPGADRPQPWPYRQPTWVFTSRSLPAVAGADIRFARGDVRPVHEQMVKAASGRNVWIVGGGDLAGQFHDAGLLDELFVQIGSVTLARESRCCHARSPGPRSGCCRCERSGRDSPSCTTRCSATRLRLSDPRIGRPVH